MSAAVLLLLIQPSLLDHSIEQWRRQPETRIEDAYKWLFHATQGGDHAVSNDAGPRQWMEREWRQMPLVRFHEPETVALRPDGKVLRVNLRPFKARGGVRDMLLAIFVASAQQFRPDRREFVREWTALGVRLQRAPIGKITRAEWSRFDGATKAEGYPAIHHSKAYEAAYMPAYRVVLGDLWH